MFIPGRGELLDAAAGFQLFATHTTSISSRKFESSVMIHNHFSEVLLQELSSVELEHIIVNKFPELKIFISQIMETFLLVSDSAKLSTALMGLSPEEKSMFPLKGSFSVGTRPFSTRDLFRWCNRIQLQLLAKNNNLGVGQTINDDIFCEAIDCFTANVPNPSCRGLMFLVSLNIIIMRLY